jgi:hypothetical protein
MCTAIAGLIVAGVRDEGIGKAVAVHYSGVNHPGSNLTTRRKAPWLHRVAHLGSSFFCVPCRKSPAPRIPVIAMAEIPP